MLLAFLFAWLSGLSLPERAQRIALLYFEAVCQLILDDTGLPLPTLSRIDRLRAEAGIRCAHSFLDIAIWLEACAAAGLPRPRNLQPEPYAFARHAPSADALLKRVTEFVNRWKRVRLAARRLAQHMRADPLGSCTSLTSAFPAQAGNQTRSRRLRSSSIDSALRALSGCPPSRATRWTRFAFTDGPTGTSASPRAPP